MADAITKITNEEEKRKKKGVIAEAPACHTQWIPAFAGKTIQRTGFALTGDEIKEGGKLEGLKRVYPFSSLSHFFVSFV